MNVNFGTILKYIGIVTEAATTITAAMASSPDPSVQAANAISAALDVAEPLIVEHNGRIKPQIDDLIARLKGAAQAWAETKQAPTATPTP